MYTRSLAHSFIQFIAPCYTFLFSSEQVFFYVCKQANQHISVCMYAPYTDVYRIFDSVRVHIMCMGAIRYVFRVQLRVFHNHDFELHFYELKIIQYRIHTNRANI